MHVLRKCCGYIVIEVRKEMCVHNASETVVVVATGGGGLERERELNNVA